MTYRDLDQTELRYADRDILAQRLDAVQAHRAVLEERVQELTRALQAAAALDPRESTEGEIRNAIVKARAAIDPS